MIYTVTFTEYIEFFFRIQKNKNYSTVESAIKPSLTITYLTIHKISQKLENYSNPHNISEGKIAFCGTNLC